MYLVDSFYNKKDSEFIEIITKDLKEFTKNIKINKLLLIPPIDNYHRYLTHQIIQESFHNLNSFSIGDKDQRRLFICSKDLNLKNNVNKDYNQETSMTSQIQEPAVSPTAVSKKKRPTQQVYVPKGRRNLAPASPPLSASSSPEVKKKEEPQSDLLIDSSIVGYLKNSPEIVKKPHDNDACLDTQMKSMSLNENNTIVDTNVNKLDNTDVTGDSWDTLYDETGDCKNQNLIKELNKIIEDKISIEVENLEPINYLKWSPKDVEIEESALPHVIEIYDFPEQFKNEDIIDSLRICIGHTNFDLKWVDDTHCLGVFSTSNAATEALKLNHALLKVRPISKATQASKNKSQKLTDHLKPYKPRPQTTSLVASKLIGHSLGLNNLLTSEKANEEKLKLKNARDKRRKEKELNEAIWNGDV